MRKEDLPGVSLIVPAYNEEKDISKTIKSLLKLNYPKDRLEIIVVDDGSTDRTYEVVKKFEKYGVKVFKKKRGGKSRAINFGTKKAKFEIVGVVDSDTTLERNSLLNCVKCFDSEDVASVTSRILQRRKKKILERWQDIELKIIAYIRKLFENLNIITATPGPLSLYRKKVLTKIGGFDKNCILEDNEIAWRLIYHGYRIRMAYDAKVYTNMPDTFKRWFLQRVRWGVGGLQIITKYIGTFIKRHPVGTFLLPSWILGYVFSTIGISLFFYTFFYTLYMNLSYYLLSFKYGTNPFVFSLDFNPDFLFFYGIILFFLSLIIIVKVLGEYKKRASLFDLVTFIFIYLVFFPIISFYSIFKFIILRKKLKIKPVWLTK
ncbi:MAG: glycosyltransferase family 2 protein [Candidatus Aenigmarchaeota archaeon]|nr:glycosyltransferase family 2 protein [Candidatus Aenigmarchaeota archaeon]